MPIAESVLVLTDEDGHETRAPIYKSSMIKFERKFKRPFALGSVIDAATMSFYLTHDQRWPGSDQELEDWFDSVRFEVEETEPSTNGESPTNAPSALS